MAESHPPTELASRQPVPPVPASGQVARAVPPPPPPAATLPPVRPPAKKAKAAEVPSGVGAAKGVRWKGELDDVAAQNEDEAEQEDVVEETLREAPAWLFSLVIHLILLLALALFSTPAGRSFTRVALTMGPAEAETDSDDISEFLMENPMDSMVESFDDQPVETPVEVEMTDTIDAMDLPEPESLLSMEVPIEAGMLPIKPMVTGRSGAMKSALLAAYGGNGETVEAVDLGLAWLKAQQKSNGSWSLVGSYTDGAQSESTAAATAMALLAFQGDGNTHQSGKYSEEVAKAIKWLVDEQNRQGFFASKTRADHSAAYAQAQCTIAISELYAMTQDSWLREPAQRAVNYAERAQSATGGWRYNPSAGDADLSVTGWYVMALESARSGGLEVDPTVLYKISDYLDRVQVDGGSAYGYQRGVRESKTMSAEGLLSRQYLGWARNNEKLKEGVNRLMTQQPFNIDQDDFYYWYYGTQVMHHYGGAPWKQWNAKMRVQLPKAQVKKGNMAGSWSPQGTHWGGQGGRLYTTCMAIYCLEVYYRHLPLYTPNVDPE
ncbi:hypothetical protein FF011L_35330 [Roseimaritima multifibrata]|uniref:Squalene cyclase C-terminal domain-containing protein n=1 Tax=Roseimaritima multifibrata TaxID=1930274 RepID=A0A517MIN0_9BACT|nr:hypothetical protein FF011L_35330 [Roseimaritima multifibrata]